MVPNKEHQQFLNDFEHLIQAPTVEEYNKRRNAFIAPGNWPLTAVKYVKGWLK
jgi:transposase-like protein